MIDHAALGWLVSQAMDPKYADVEGNAYEYAPHAPSAQRPTDRRRLTGESASDDDERPALAMLYRGQVEFAVGHGVSVHWELSAGSVDRAIAVRTQVVPWYDVPLIIGPASARKAGIRRTNR